jgi:hypothetical protein
MRPEMLRRHPASIPSDEAWQRAMPPAIFSGGTLAGILAGILGSTVEAPKKLTPFALQQGPYVASALTSVPVPSDVAGNQKT